MNSTSVLSKKSTSEIDALIRAHLASSPSLKSNQSPAIDANLFAEGYLDSIGIMKLIAHLESQLEMKIPPKDLVPKNFISIQAMLSYLRIC